MKALLICMMMLFTFGYVAEGVAGMFGFGKKVDVFLCPEVHGQITLNGEPLSGVKVMREVVYDDEFVDYAVTSGSGAFTFGELHTRSRTPGRPFDETRTVQAITAEYQDKQYLLWAYATDSISEESSISERLGSLRCDLSDEEIYHHFPRPDSSHLTYNVKGLCRWDF